MLGVIMVALYQMTHPCHITYCHTAVGVDVGCLGVGLLAVEQMTYDILQVGLANHSVAINIAEGVWGSG